MEKKIKYGVIAKCAVLALIVVEYATSIATPALGKMAAYFLEQGVNPELIKQVQSLPNLTMIIVALSVGQIEKVLSKRMMVIIASVVILIGGVAPVFGGGIYFILVCRAVLGLGRGIIFPLALAFVPDLFEGKERDSLMGLQGGVGAISGIIYMTLAAVLVSASWRNAFWLYLAIVPLLILVIFKLPEPVKKQAATNKDGTAKSRLSVKTWMIIFGNLFAMIAIYSFITNMAIVIEFKGIGSAMKASNILSTFVIGAFIAGVIFGKVRESLGRFTQSVSILFMGVSFIILLAANSLTIYFVAGVIFGLGFGTYNPDIFLRVADSADKSAAALSLSLFMAFNGMGQFISNIVLFYIGKVFNLDATLSGWMIAGPVLIGSAVVLFLLNLVAVRNKNLVNEGEYSV